MCLGFIDPIPTHPGSITVLQGHLSPLPLTVHFLLTLQFDQKVFIEPCGFPAFPAWFLTCGNSEILHSMKSILKGLPVLICSFIRKDSFPVDPIHWFFKHLEFQPPKVQRPDLNLHYAHPYRSRSKLPLHDHAALIASDPDLFNDLRWWAQGLVTLLLWLVVVLWF